MKNIEPTQPSAGPEDLSTVLLDHLGAFRAFARRRLGDDQLAADAVQESLLKAIRAEPGLSDRENLLAWFYRILRNVLTDLHRRRAAGNRATSAYAADLETASDGDADMAEICGCLHALLPAMQPACADLIRRHELDGVPQAELAQELGITANNLKVRLHRARRQLRALLEKACTVCATHGCLDCSCERHA